MTTIDRVALFIDVDNVLILAQNSGLPFDLTLIIDRVRQHGSIMSSKAYADWNSSLLKPFLGDFRANALELVQLPIGFASSEHKNTADIQLAVDALEMVFSTVRPDSIVIVGGDRDYVPLVQKLKRYGVFVMGIGVEAGVSKVLINACDSFVFYDDILPPEPEESTEPSPLPDPTGAYSLMRRAIEVLQREERSTSGAAVLSMMKQLDPAFDLARYKQTLKDLAQSAQEAGHVRVIENPGSDFNLAVDSSKTTPTAALAEFTKREYDYSTIDTTTASYRTILQEQRIPLLPWHIRREFIVLIWDDFANQEASGLSIHEIREALLDHCYKHSLGVSLQMIQKLLYTLNFARCFAHSKDPESGELLQIPHDLDVPIHPAVDVDEALLRLHKRYLEILARDAALLRPESVFDLLFGNEISDEKEKEDREQEMAALCQEIKPPSQVAQAILLSSPSDKTSAS